MSDFNLSSSIVSTSDPIATESAIDILKNGGNAFDAALCASMVLSVTLPMSNGIGGDGVFLLWDSKNKKSSTINALGVAPSNVKNIYDFFSSADNSVLKRIIPPRIGMLTASLPALVYGWLSLAKYCSCDIPFIASKAIELAKFGFIPDRKFRRWARVNFNVIKNDNYLKGMFEKFIDPDCISSNELFKQPELGCFLDLFSKTIFDSKPEWESVLASESVKASAENKGVFNLSDFYESEQCVVEEPLQINIRDYKVLTSGSTTQGYMALIAANLMDELNVYGESGILQSAKIFHILFKERIQRFGDKGLNQSDWLLQKLSNSSISDYLHDVSELEFSEGSLKQPVLADGDTTFFYVVDSKGNAASCIQSLSLGFGSGVSAPGIGMIFNSRLTRGMSIDKCSPNMLKPHCKPISTIFPVMGIKDNSLDFIGGTPGGDVQVQLNSHIINLLVRYGNLDHWVNNSRWKYSPVSDVFDQSNGLLPTINYESCLDESSINLLQSSGLKVVQKKNIGGNVMYCYNISGKSIKYFDEGRENGLTVLMN